MKIPCRIDSSVSEFNSRGEAIRTLFINDDLWMINNDSEYADMKRALETAKGDCYIGGLGLGLIALECAKLPLVESVLVVEINPYVIDLVGSSICDPKIKIMQGDARYDFFNKQYDWIYFDIWLGIDRDGREMFLACQRNCQKYLKANGTVEAWYKDRLLSGYF